MIKLSNNKMPVFIPKFKTPFQTGKLRNVILIIIRFDELLLGNVISIIIRFDELLLGNDVILIIIRFDELLIGNVILIIIRFDELLLGISPRIIDCFRSYQTRMGVFTFNFIPLQTPRSLR